jgi:thioredoxin 1
MPDISGNGLILALILQRWKSKCLSSLNLHQMESFSQLINSEKPVLVDFYADWCGPCKAMSPVIQEVAKAVQGKARVIKVDIDKSVQAAQAYQVQAVPTFIIFKNGKIVWRYSGMIDKSSLINRLTQTAQ